MAKAKSHPKADAKAGAKTTQAQSSLQLKPSQKPTTSKATANKGADKGAGKATKKVAPAPKVAPKVTSGATAKTASNKAGKGAGKTTPTKTAPTKTASNKVASKVANKPATKPAASKAPSKSVKSTPSKANKPAPKANKPATAMQASKQPPKQAQPSKQASKQATPPKPSQPPKQAKPPKKASFKVGDKVVYPAHGVGQITAIKSENMEGSHIEFFVINFAKDRLVLRLPTSGIAESGLRAMSINLDSVVQTLKKPRRVKRTMWSRRAQEYETKISSGDPVSIAEVIRDLYRKPDQNEQSYSERQIYQDALERLAGEFAEVKGMSVPVASQELENILRAS